MINFKNINWQLLHHTIVCISDHLEMEEESLERRRFVEMLYLGLVYKYFLDFDDELIPFDVIGVVKELAIHGIPPEYLLESAEMYKDVKKLDLDRDDPDYPTVQIKQMLRLEPYALPELSIDHFKRWMRPFVSGAKYYSVPSKRLIEGDEEVMNLVYEPIEPPSEIEQRMGTEFFNLDWRNNVKPKKG
jgi:hypothetical protein